MHFKNSFRISLLKNFRLTFSSKQEWRDDPLMSWIELKDYEQEHHDFILTGLICSIKA